MPRSRRKLLLVCGGAPLSAGYAAQPDRAGRLQPQTASDRPNMVLVVLDDVSFSDVSAFGSEIRTPNIDVIESEELRNNQFDNTAVCSPTRAAQRGPASEITAR